MKNIVMFSVVVMLLCNQMGLHAMELKPPFNPDRLIILQKLGTQETGNKLILGAAFFACIEIYTVYQNPSKISNHVPAFITSLIAVPLSLYYYRQNTYGIPNDKKTN